MGWSGCPCLYHGTLDLTYYFPILPFIFNLSSTRSDTSQKLQSDALDPKSVIVFTGRKHLILNSLSSLDLYTKPGSSRTTTS